MCISVSVDEEEDKEKAVSFLKSVKANCTNVLLNEQSDVWQGKWKFTSIPCVVIYGRDGKQAAMFNYDNPDKQFTYKDVEKALEPMLKSK